MTALRAKLHAFVDELADMLERSDTAEADEWVDQTNSPLGRRRHCELARKGVLPASLDGRRYKVRRADVERYLQTKALVVVDPKASEDAEVDRVIAMLSTKKRRTG